MKATTFYVGCRYDSNAVNWELPELLVFTTVTTVLWIRHENDKDQLLCNLVRTL